MKRFIASAFATLMLATLLVVPASAFSKPLDEILDYTITVDMRSDGTMDIRYDVSWKVLDSTSEGPLEWVKIGCPNNHVDEITSLSRREIKKIGYMSEGDKSYIRVDFKESHKAGEVVNFSYSIHQSYMYVIEDDEHICRYSFTPGWFDEIDVDQITIRWNSVNVLDSTPSNVDADGYLVWSASLRAGERLNASVRYNLDVFDTDPEQQYVEGHRASIGSYILVGIAIILVVFLVIALLAWLFGGDDYDGGRGFGGSHHTTIIHTGGCVRSSCACACVSCACACACAGGGRAGCSLKDFYHTNLRTETLNAAFDELNSDKLKR